MDLLTRTQKTRLLRRLQENARRAEREMRAPSPVNWTPRDEVQARRAEGAAKAYRHAVELVKENLKTRKENQNEL